MKKIVFFANSDWYLYNFRIALACYVRELGAEVVMVSPPGNYTKLIEAKGFRWVPVEMSRRSTNPATEIAVVFRLAKILRQEKPDLIHNFTIKSVVYGSIAAKIARVNSIVNAVAGLGFVFSNSGLQARVLKPVVKSLLKFALGGANSRLILQNPDDRTLFCNENLVESASICVIKGSGVNIQRFQPELRRDDGHPLTVLMASRLLWDKGVMEYVEAAKEIKASRGDIRFVLAGSPDDGNPGSVTELDLQRWRDDGVIEPVGHIADMVSMLGQTDIVVLPTRYGEGVPRVLIEAAAAGIPLVGTNVPGCREVIIPDENGLLVEPGDVTGLAKAILRLLDNQAMRTRMSEKGRDLVLREFDEDVVFRKTLQVYRELIAL